MAAQKLVQRLEVNKRFRATLTMKNFTAKVSFHLTDLNNRKVFVQFGFQFPCDALSLVLSLSLFKALLLKKVSLCLSELVYQ